MSPCTCTEVGGEHQLSCSVVLCLIPLGQALSPSLRPGWWVAHHITFLTAVTGVSNHTLAFSSGSWDLNSGPNDYMERALASEPSPRPPPPSFKISLSFMRECRLGGLWLEAMSGARDTALCVLA